MTQSSPVAELTGDEKKVREWISKFQEWRRRRKNQSTSTVDTDATFTPTSTEAPSAEDVHIDPARSEYVGCDEHVH